MKSIPSRVRVTSGSAGGLFLKIPARFPSRPTQDRIKQAVFSSLASCVPGATVLDLYAGTGSLGIEALSRGAASAVLVDMNKDCCQTIRENLAHCRLSADVVCQDAVLYLAHCDDLQFDLVLADPPYVKEKQNLAEDATLRQSLAKLKVGGILVWEHFSHNSWIGAAPAGFLLKTSRYGETSVTYFTRS